MQQELIDKIAKLLALAEKNNNVHEAATAAAMAQRLLTEHRLTMVDVESSQEEKIEERDPLFESKVKTTWKGVLVRAVCDANGCVGFWHSCSWGKMRIVGRLSDVQIVRYFYTYLEREIERLCMRAMRVQDIDAGEERIRGKSQATSYKYGAACEISDRLKAEAEDAQAKASVSAIVRITHKDQEVRDFCKRTIGLATRNVRAHINHDAFERGRAAGRGIALNRGLDGRPVKMLR